MKKLSILGVVLLAGCASDSESDFLAPPGTGLGAESDEGSDATGGADDGGDDGGDGTEGGSGNDGTQDAETDETGDGGGTGGTSDAPDDSTGSSADVEDTTTTGLEDDSSSDGDTSTAGGDTTTGGAIGEEKFPGDWCDPFVDWCVDAGGDYECMRDGNMLPNNDYEVIFKCNLFKDNSGDGTHGESCHLYPWESCRTSLMCIGSANYPAWDCASGSCCADLCQYQEICANGQECEPTVWQSILADYLDKYTAIGHCPPE